MQYFHIFINVLSFLSYSNNLTTLITLITLLTDVIFDSSKLNNDPGFYCKSAKGLRTPFKT